MWKPPTLGVNRLGEMENLRGALFVSSNRSSHIPAPVRHEKSLLSPIGQGAPARPLLLQLQYFLGVENFLVTVNLNYSLSSFIRQPSPAFLPHRSSFPRCIERWDGE